MNSKPSLRETPKNMKRFGHKVSGKEIGEIRKSFENYDRRNEREQASKRQVQLKVLNRG